MGEKTDPTNEGTQGNLRKRLRAPLLVKKVRMDPGGKVFFGYAKNLSRGGIFIATTNPREEGSQFQLEMDLPAPLNLTVQCTCEVVWKREFARKSPYEPGMGLKFIDLSDEVAEKIDRWVLSSLAE